MYLPFYESINTNLNRSIEFVAIVDSKIWKFLHFESLFKKKKNLSIKWYISVQKKRKEVFVCVAKYDRAILSHFISWRHVYSCIRSRDIKPRFRLVKICDSSDLISNNNFLLLWTVMSVQLLYAYIYFIFSISKLSNPTNLDRLDLSFTLSNISLVKRNNSC